jgi:crotonobetainyl-CoA:carnitine CoA-transferase CaiB-like acyl-CoA transferase
MNRGKRAITLDLTVPDGVALAKALVKGADAVIENYSPRCCASSASTIPSSPR